MRPVRRIELAWELGWTADPRQEPEQWVPAQVPGAVQLDWARAEGWPPYWHGNEYERYRWMEDVTWIYRARIPEMDLDADTDAVKLMLEGADPWAWVSTDQSDELVRAGCWQRTVVELASPGGTVPKEVRVAFEPLGVEENVQETRGWGRYWKSAVQFGWDFCPRLIPIGLFAPAYLHVGPCELTVELSAIFDPKTGEGHLTLNGWEAPSEGCVETRAWLREPGGREWTAASETGESASLQWELTVDGVHPWSPDDPFLYELTLEAYSEATGVMLQRIARKVGFRRTELVHYPGAWQVHSPVEGSETPPPFTLRVNGEDTFVRGSNWVPPSIFPGTVDEALLRPLLETAKATNLNLLRVWGGGGPMPPVFYDLCDELGLMVWQEFPLACARYEGTPEYMAMLDEEAPEILQRLQPYACLALWSGGNELFNPWSAMTPQDAAIRSLNSWCWIYAPETPFIPTSPIFGVRHGDYRFVNHKDQEVHRIFAESSATAYAEFGVPGPSPAAVIREFMPDDELWPPREGGGWSSHFFYKAWDGDVESWGMWRHLLHYFGEPQSLEQMVEWGQLLQAEGLKALYEEARRQAPRCGMALNWCFNEPWPCAANNSLVAWPCEPKPALTAVRDSLRPQVLTAAVRRFTWAPGERLEAELWVHNDQRDVIPPLHVEAWLASPDGAVSDRALWRTDPTERGHPQRSSKVDLVVPASATGRFTLHVEALERPAMNTVYTFLHPRSRQGDA